MALLKCWVLWVTLCVTRKVPPGNLKVSLVLLVEMSTPLALNTPKASTLLLLDVSEVDTAWKCSVPVLARWEPAGCAAVAGCAVMAGWVGLAEATPAPAIIVPVAAAAIRAV